MCGALSVPLRGSTCGSAATLGEAFSEVGKGDHAIPRVHVRGCGGLGLCVRPPASATPAGFLFFASSLRTYVSAVYGHRCDGGRFLCVSRAGTCAGSVAETSLMRAIAREWRRLGAERLGPPLPAPLWLFRAWPGHRYTHVPRLSPRRAHRCSRHAS